MKYSKSKIKNSIEKVLQCKVDVIFWYIGWITLFLMITGPTSIPYLPSGIRLYDILFAPVVCFFIYKLITGIALKPFRSVPLILLIIYLSLVLLFPLMGIIYYGDYITWYLGDLRWVQVVIVFGTLYSITNRSFEWERAFELTLIWILLFQIPFILTQVSLVLLDISPPFFMNYWYPDGGGGYGYYGQLYGRFAGAMIRAATLTLIAGVGFMYSSLTFIKKPNLKYFLLIIISSLLILSSGTRTIMVSIPIIVLLLIIIRIMLLDRSIKRKIIYFTSLLLIVVPVLGYVAYVYNIGRVATSNRYVELLELAGNLELFYEITGRGGDRWNLPIEEAFSEWSILGTLVNSSHALDHLDAMDSYIVLTISQAGPFIISAFITLIFYLIYQGVHSFLNGKRFSIIVLSCTMPIFIAIFTQNTMTSLGARVIITLAVTLLVIDKCKKCSVK